MFAPGARPEKGRDIPILLYHHLENGSEPAGANSLPLWQFKSHLDILRRGGWTTVCFRELCEAMEGRRTWPKRCVWITFDDGYESFLRLGVPALQKQSMSATVFVVAGEIGGINRWDVAIGLPERRLLNKDGLKAVVRAGMEIGSHGWSHRDLNLCRENERTEEISRSRLELEAVLGDRIQAFAYPYGNYASRHFKPLAQAGYQGAVSIASSARAVTGNAFAMRRVCLQARDRELRFRLNLSRFYWRYRAWRDPASL